MPFNVGQNGGNIKNIFATDYDLVNNLTGHELWTWGFTQSYGVPRGFLGDNSSISKSSPVQVVGSATNWRSLTRFGGIKTDGTLWMWGCLTCGSLGNNSTAAVSSPVQTISGGTNWKSASSSSRNTAAIKTDGTLWTWGISLAGALGDNTATNKSSPVQTIAGGTSWRQVSVGIFHMAATKTDGTLWTWGSNGCTSFTAPFGQLGDNTDIFRSSPVQVVGNATNWKQVAAGSNLTAAIKTDGTLWTWGRNNYGNLGDNTAIYRSSPVQVVGNATNWKFVSAPPESAPIGAIKTDGTLWMWGNNFAGYLGNNQQSFSVSFSSPVQTIAGGTNWRSISAGRNVSAIKTDGTLWTWGYNSRGAVGDNSITNRSSPVQTIARGTNWRDVISTDQSTTQALRLFSGYDF